MHINQLITTTNGTAANLDCVARAQGSNLTNSSCKACQEICFGVCKTYVSLIGKPNIKQSKRSKNQPAGNEG